MWEPVQSELGDEYHLIVPDMPGHDHSADEDYIAHEQTLTQLRAMLAERATGDVHVVGAQLALALASEAQNS